VGGADLEQAKQSDLATVAILGDGDFLRVVQNILDDLGGGGSAGLERARGDSTILGGWTANCACEKK
jgi:hypothetical protein